MRVCIATLESISPYSQSRHYETEKLNKERPDDYEARTWRDRLHADDSGEVFIPPMAFKNALSEIAKFLSVQIPGKGKATFTKHFEAGVLVMEAAKLGIKKENVEGEWFFVPADGRRGGSKRVKKCFPVIRNWQADVKFYILDETVTREVFEQHLVESGRFIGIGRFRPRNNGFYGRFKVLRTNWQQE
jgi:hypothetical protein